MKKNISVRNMLVKSADKIVKVSDSSIKEYEENMDMLVAALNDVMIKREDISKLIGGENNITMMKNNHQSHLHFVASILQIPDSETLVDTLLWVFNTFMSRGFIPDYWEVQISTLIQLMKKDFSEKTFFEILNIYNWMRANICNFIIIEDEKK